MTFIIVSALKLDVIFEPGDMGPMVAATLKLGIAILNGGNTSVQQVGLKRSDWITDVMTITQTPKF